MADQQPLPLFAPMNVYEAAQAQRSRLLRGERQAVDQLERRWLLARGLIENDLNRVLANIKRAQDKGEDHSPSWLFRAGRLNNLLDTVQQQVNLYAGYAIDLTEARAKTLATTGVLDARQLLAFSADPQDPGSPITGANFARPNERAINQLIAQFGPDGPVPKTMGKLSAEAVERTQDVMVAGFARGEHPSVLARRMLGVQEDPTENGELDLTRYDATRIARTEPFRAYRVASTETYQANADVVEEQEWNAFPGPRTCIFCLARDGKRFPLGTIMATHPHCRCCWVPVTFLSQPKAFTGQDYLDSVSEAEQDDLFRSHAAGELYRQGKISLEDMTVVRDHPQWGPVGHANSLEGLKAAGKISNGDVAEATRTRTPKRVTVTKPADLNKAAAPTQPVPVKAPEPTPEPPKVKALAESVDLAPKYQKAATTGVQKDAQRTLELIDQVHSVPDDMPSVPLVKHTNRTQEGVYKALSSGKPYNLSLNASSNNRQGVAAHEFGHFVDHHALGVPGANFASEDPDLSPAAAQVIAWRDAVRQSETVKGLIQRSREYKQFKDAEGDYYAKHIDGYLLDVSELWARSYAQWIATATGDKKLIGQVAQSLAADAEILKTELHWPDDDFAPIASALAAIFRALGLLK